MLKNNRGIALLITLTAIVVMVAVGFELNRQIQSSAAKTGIGRDMITLQQMLASGVSIAESILIKDKNETEADSVQEGWADPEIVQQYVEAAGFEDDSLLVEITDELGRIQANALVQFPEGKEFNPAQRQLWARFFNLILYELENREEAGNAFAESLEPDMIINPVKDWLDSGDDDAITGLSGAEQYYYMSLEAPYSCRNGPFRHISELARVKNIDPVMFSKIGENQGLSDFITVYGMEPSSKDKHEPEYPGRININTAPVPVLAALLPEGHEFLAEEIADYRQAGSEGEYVNDLKDPGWYKNVAGLGDVDIKDELIRTKSDLFRIRCRAEKNGNSLAATVLVQRQQEKESGKWECKVLKWRYALDL
ncbi:MAG: general secretion pathway protein GspK [Desulfobacteraceae bacterium]|nr:general secretion pathway protein GspK [Desulfobacteraceae bacterium]